MGTNFYWHEHAEEQACSTCLHVAPSRKLHIGKSSGGWVFALRIHPDEDINTLDDWKARWASGGVVRDEYGSEHTPEEMLSTIVDRAPASPPVRRYGQASGYRNEAEMLRSNHAELHPSGLLRADLVARAWLGTSCARSHGEGTWDYCLGEFS